MFNIVNYGAGCSKDSDHIVPFKPPKQITPIPGVVPLATRLTPGGMERTAEWKKKQAEKKKMTHSDAVITKSIEKITVNIEKINDESEKDQVILLHFFLI